jgi:hypothetical protein
MSPPSPENPSPPPVAIVHNKLTRGGGRCVCVGVEVEGVGVGRVFVGWEG